MSFITFLQHLGDSPPVRSTQIENDLSARLQIYSKSSIFSEDRSMPLLSIYLYSRRFRRHLESFMRWVHPAIAHRRESGLGVLGDSTQFVLNLPQNAGDGLER